MSEKSVFIRVYLWFNRVMTDISNYYEYKTSDTPSSLVIMLHGYGSNGQDLIGLAPMLAQELPDTMFVSPDAPFNLEMMPPMGGYQWFSLLDRTSEVMLEGAEGAAPILEGFVDAMAQRFEIPHAKIALLGFSQGTMMSLYTAPRMPQKIAGVLGYSGALLGGEGLVEDPDEFQNFPIRLIHGEADDVVPVAARSQAQELLTKAGYTVSGHTTPGLTHSIDEDGIRSGVEFLREILR